MKKRDYKNTIGDIPLPQNPRPGSIPRLDNYGLLVEPPKDPWWINSKKNCYCFWSYVNDKSNRMGEMEALNIKQISVLLGITPVQAKAEYHAAIQDLNTHLKIKDLEDALSQVFLK